MSVFKRKSGTGETEFFHYRFMLAGKTYSGVCTGCSDIASAQKFESEIKEKVQDLKRQKSVKALVENFAHELSGGEKIPIENGFTEFAKRPTRKKSAGKHMASKESRYNDFVAFVKATLPDRRYLSDIKEHDAELYISYIRSHGRFKKRTGAESELLSPQTLNRHLEELHALFSALAKRAGIIENPFAGIEPLDESDNGESGREAFSQDELEIVINKANPFIFAIFKVGLFTAFREGDIATFRWSDIIWEREIIKRKLLKTGVIVEVPIMAPLAEFLKSQLGKDPEYVLPEHAAMYRENPSGISYRVKKFLEEECGIVTTKHIEGRSRAVSIKDVHSLRHTFCYFAGVAGIPLVIVQSIVGHLTPEMTAHYMAHADINTKRDMMKRLPNFTKLLPVRIDRSLLRDQIRERLKRAIDEAHDELLLKFAELAEINRSRHNSEQSGKSI
jgi:integrase